MEILKVFAPFLILPLFFLACFLYIKFKDYKSNSYIKEILEKEKLRNEKVYEQLPMWRFIVQYYERKITSATDSLPFLINDYRELTSIAITIKDDISIHAKLNDKLMELEKLFHMYETLTDEEFVYKNEVQSAITNSVMKIREICKEHIKIV